MTDRRRFLTRLGAAGAALAGAGWFFSGPPLSQRAWVASLLGEVEQLTRRAQRLVARQATLAPEFSKADIAPVFRANGTLAPDSDGYRVHAANGFADWQIAVTGLVEHPLALSLAALRALPARTQITRHDCVEGWSCIGEWTGTPLAIVLAAARPLPSARYVVFHCADNMSAADETAQFYYESLDLTEATHPQTILAYDLNGAPLPIANGAPVRLRAERQLGYKMAKYIKRIELVSTLAPIAGGKGGYWEDRGYSWWAGI